MIKEKKPIAPKSSKKESTKTFNDQLALALAGFKSQVGEKKFKNILKKTSKLIAESIAKAEKKNKKASVIKKKVTAKKVGVKKTALKK